MLSDGQSWVSYYLIAEKEKIQLYRTKRYIADSPEQVKNVLGTINNGMTSNIGLLSLFCVEFDPHKSKLVRLEKYQS